MSIVIPPGLPEACIQFFATDDDIVEGCEVFTMTAETSNANDTINGTTSIIIIDNDGKDDNNNIANGVPHDSNWYNLYYMEYKTSNK